LPANTGKKDEPLFNFRPYLATWIATQVKFKMRSPFHTLMVQGSTSDAGKTTLVAAHAQPHRSAKDLSRPEKPEADTAFVAGLLTIK
jgi:hypothetical protein